MVKKIALVAALIVTGCLVLGCVKQNTSQTATQANSASRSSKTTQGNTKRSVDKSGNAQNATVKASPTSQSQLH